MSVVKIHPRHMCKFKESRNNWQKYMNECLNIQKHRIVFLIILKNVDTGTSVG